jgi:hypothetical protein
LAGKEKIVFLAAVQPSIIKMNKRNFETMISTNSSSLSQLTMDGVYEKDACRGHFYRFYALTIENNRKFLLQHYEKAFLSRCLTSLLKRYVNIMVGVRSNVESFEIMSSRLKVNKNTLLDLDSRVMCSIFKFKLFPNDWLSTNNVEYHKCG